MLLKQKQRCAACHAPMLLLSVATTQVLRSAHLLDILIHERVGVDHDAVRVAVNHLLGREDMKSQSWLSDDMPFSTCCLCASLAEMLGCTLLGCGKMSSKVLASECLRTVAP